MDDLLPKVTTSLACRIVGLDRARFNEAVSGGYLLCAPETIAGRSRLFLPEDLLALWYFGELVKDGYTRERAGRVACAIADAARRYPEAAAISYVEDYFSAPGKAFPAEMVLDQSKWDVELFNHTDIRKVTTFRVSKARALIAHETARVISTVGDND
jgi:hypothetical protein